MKKKQTPLSKIRRLKKEVRDIYKELAEARKTESKVLDILALIYSVCYEYKILPNTGDTLQVPGELHPEYRE